MAVIGQVLVQFVFRLTFGMALAMGLTPSRLVTSGYYRVHLWVLMGLNTLASLAIYSARNSHAAWAPWPWLLGIAIALTTFSYAGAVVWLYERTTAGTRLLFGLAGLGLLAAVLALPAARAANGEVLALAALDLSSSGLLLGSTLAAMLLGHWYLNTPGMQLAPLRRLVTLMTVAVIVRGGISAAGLWLHLQQGGPTASLFGTFLVFRWLTGVFGALLMARLAWLTLKVPNTQSATGILYAGVILVFLGELVSQLLSVDALYPL